MNTADCGQIETLLICAL